MEFAYLALIPIAFVSILVVGVMAYLMGRFDRTQR